MPRGTKRIDPLCVRLPDDLLAAVHQHAEQSGVTTSEWIRDLIFRVVYGEPLGMDEGYVQGRNVGYRILLMACREAWQHAPATIEDAIKLIQAQGGAVDQGLTGRTE